MRAKVTERTQTTEVDPGFMPVIAAFDNVPDVSRGKMMSSYGLTVNGKIFAMFGRGKFVAKLHKKRVDDLVSAGIGERFNPGHGKLMKEWIAIGAKTVVGLSWPRKPTNS
jgi:hypothetical protein